MKTDREERRYHLAMANLCAGRGFLNLAQAYLVAAKDCPARCGCLGCERTQAEVREAKARRGKRGTRAEA